MGLNSKHRIFFVNKVEEISLCGSKVFQITGSDFTKPTGFNKLQYPKHNLNTCGQCKEGYIKTFKRLENKFSKFPHCCEPHSKLIGQEWFNRKDFENTPQLYTDKLFYTWHHILNFVETDTWKEEIIDFIEYIFETFGSFPEGFGEPLYFSCFIHDLKEFVNNLTDYPDKRDEILDFINKYQSSPQKKKTDWNVLMSIYDEWFRTFPFDLSFFSHLKDHFAKNIPLIEDSHTNKYLGLTKASPKTKSSLVASLLKTTEQLLLQINVATLYEKGLIDDFDKIKLELIFQERKQKLKRGYINHSSNPNTKYRKILKEWLGDEIKFINDIEPIVNKVNKKLNLYGDILQACAKMIENKLFWNVDENTRTRQILDLLSFNYQTKDQSTYGKSEKGKKPGSVDGVIIDKNSIEYFIEAFNLESINSEVIQRHINKLEYNYDSKGLLTKFVLVYCNIADYKFLNFYKLYSDFIEDKMRFNFTKIASEHIETIHTNIKVIRTVHLREGSEVSLYHVLLKLPQKIIS